MALLKGKLFAGAVFAGLLIGGAVEVVVPEVPAVPAAQSYGGGMAAGKVPRVVKPSLVVPTNKEANAARIMRLQQDDDEVLLLITQAVGVLYG